MTGAFVFVGGVHGADRAPTFDQLACGPADQHASYNNPMDDTVTETVTVDAGFTVDEMAKIEKAVATWNAEGRRVVGHDLFKVQTGAISGPVISVPTPALQSNDLVRARCALRYKPI